MDKKVTQLLISLSFLSIFFFSSLCYYSFFLNYFSLYLSEFPFQFSSHSIDRNYVFLLCNGILVLLAKTSGLINILSPSVDDNPNDQLVLTIRIGDSLQSSKESPMKEKELRSNFVLEDEEQEEEPTTVILNTKGGGEEDEDIENGSSNGILTEEEEEDGNGNDELLNTEELNKKCDDFIRRMRQEIRIEAQHHLVIV